MVAYDRYNILNDIFFKITNGLVVMRLMMMLLMLMMILVTIMLLHTFRWLGEEAIRRCHKHRPDIVQEMDEIAYMRRSKGGALLDNDDTLKQVLDDNDFVSVGTSLPIANTIYREELFRSLKLAVRSKELYCNYVYYID